MSRNKLKTVCGTIALIVFAFILFHSLYWLCRYNFITGVLYLYMYPTWMLLLNSVIGTVGVCLSIFLLKRKIRFKLFAIIAISIFILSCISFIMVW